jgi:phosphatidylglycerophosphatase C
VAFDFDGTIVSFDTGAAFLRRLICRNPIRLALAVAVTPLVLAFAAHPNTRRWGLSFYVWIGSVGCSEDAIRFLCAQFAEDCVSRGEGVVFKDAVAALQRYRSQNRHIVVMTGSFEWLVAELLQRIDPAPCTIVASTWRRFLGGFVGHQHCVGEQKLRLGVALGLPLGFWHAGYTDSASDIPILRRCGARYLVNPDARTLARFEKAFGSDFEVVWWA